MSQTLLEMSKELVTELIRVHHLSPDEAKALLWSTHATLQSLYQAEASGSAAEGFSSMDGEAEPADWQRSISKHAIICLECGGAFRQLSTRHLRVHDLDAKSYRIKYGIPSAQPLSSRRATARRREIAHQIRPWEQAISKRGIAQAKRAGGTRQASRR
ncbi:MAG: hypothetical protein ETSY1_17440 [Candidatus Entotheonella factor]|uniref:MucR family transcriptional regulator n=1 Tax=Entotheonella factor TaxID=1429438 RepID=W4LN08_ENTF1|nr:MucR family transcriptional regulator [Candidatus Entotheonella palauensis]ETW98766.1 MAG: hypothetical protein ETSY1_17440 [Candidatus Entotheonella factor]